MHVTSEPYTQSIRIPSKRTNIALVKRFLDEIRHHRRMQEELYGNILIALTEAVNNGIIHGNKSDESKFVSVSCVAYHDRFEFTIQDEGPGFDPATLPDPCADENLLKEGGRGVHIVRTIMSDVSFYHNGHGMVIRFIAHRNVQHA